jgi:hypothetical protein
MKTWRGIGMLLAAGFAFGAILAKIANTLEF